MKTPFVDGITATLQTRKRRAPPQKARNGATPLRFKIQLSQMQADKLARISSARRSSIAQAVRDLIDAAPFP